MTRAHASPQVAAQAARPQSAVTPLVQRKARLGANSDPLEYEADRAAATILAGRNVVALSPGGATAQRKCAQCEADDEKTTVRRKCAHCDTEEKALRRKGAGLASQTSVDAAAHAVSGGGSPLTVAQRTYFEPRFGHDLSGVRLHRDAPAQRAADAIGARAYTYGSAIGFAAGESAAGTHNALLAHELAHVVQQSGGVIRRQPVVGTVDTSGGGTTAFSDTIASGPTLQADGTFSGSVLHQELAPNPAQIINTGTISVIFDPNKCIVRLPFRMNFVAKAAAGSATTCAGAGPGGLVSAGRLAEIGRETVEAVSEGLNGWFFLKVTGCNHPCKGRNIPIRVEVTQTATNPDVTLDVVNRGGRADAATICALNFNTGTNVHEAGHQRLSANDEYRERNAALRAANPTWARDERVRTDFTRMGSHHTYGRLSAFHERHFRFAQVFAQAALGAGCQVSLERARGLPNQIELSVGGGGADTNFGRAASVEAGIDARIPLGLHSRWLNLEAGLHALYLRTPSAHRNDLLLGARIGLSAQTYPADPGVSAGVFLGFGASVLRDIEPYAEVGAKFGFRGKMHEGRRKGIELEAAMGRIVNDDPNRLNYARIGLNFVYSM